MNTHNNLMVLNMLRARGVAVVRTPGGVVAYGLSRLPQNEREMFNRLTQGELSAALRIQK